MKHILNIAHKAVIVSLVGITLFGSIVVCDFGYKVISRAVTQKSQTKAIKPNEKEKS